MKDVSIVAAQALSVIGRSSTVGIVGGADSVSIEVSISGTLSAGSSFPNGTILVSVLECCIRGNHHTSSILEVVSGITRQTGSTLAIECSAKGISCHTHILSEVGIV